MEILVSGEGNVAIRLIDQNGRTLIEENIMVCGTATVKGYRNIALEADTHSGRVSLAPVLVGKSNPRQQVTFDGQNPSLFARNRCREIGCTADVINEAERGCASPLTDTDVPLFMDDEQMIARLIKLASPNEEEQIE